MGGESFGAKTLEELEESIVTTQENAEEILDEYYSSQGLEDFGLEELNAALERNDVISGEGTTFVVPRQIPARTVEQTIFRGAAEEVGQHLVQEDILDDYSIRTVGLKDRMDSRNPEKRGYARVPVLSDIGVDILGIASPQDGHMLDSHQVSPNEAQEEAVEEYFDVEPSEGNLRGFHSDLLEPGTGTGDITGVQRELMEELFSEEIYPDIGIDVDGKAVLTRYDEEDDTYRSLDDGTQFSQERLTDEGFLLAEDSYRLIAFPYSFSDNVIHMLNGLEEKFRGNGNQELEEKVPSETPFPVVDFAGIEQNADIDQIYDVVTSTSDYSSYADSSSSLPDDSFGVVSNTYVGESLGDEVPEMRAGESFAEYGARYVETLVEDVEPELQKPLTKDLQ